MVQGRHSIVDFYGKTLIFSYDSFVTQIVKGGNCFLCGAKPDSKPFSDEHIIPKWLLRRHNLFDKSITLPNGKLIPYRSYAVPCCEECNQFLGREIEEPVSELIPRLIELGEKGTKDLIDEIQENIELIFVWLNLLYLKVYLKDAKIRYHLDTRMGTESIYSRYEHFMVSLHHVHCVARSRYTGIQLSPEIIGSMNVYIIDPNSFVDEFDYVDSFFFTILVRFGNFAIVSVLDDASVAYSIFEESLETNEIVVQSLGPLQLREITARYAYINSLLENRPEFYTEGERFGPYKMKVKVDSKVKLRESDLSELGVLMSQLFAQYEDQLKDDLGDNIMKDIATGKLSFMLAEREKENKD